MRFCINYNKDTAIKASVDNKLLEQVDEININYNPNDFTLMEFLEKYQEKQINIFFNEETIKFAEKMNEEIQKQTITDGSEFDLVE